MSNEMPAVGDDSLAIANQLLRLADQFSDKTGLAMYLRVAANLLRRADEVIRLRAANGWQAVPTAALKWLFGEGPDENGHWFGDVEIRPSLDGEPMEGKFWWRSRFRAMLAATAP